MIPPKAKLRTMIAEDEPLGRERLINLVESESDLDCVGVATDGVETTALLDKLKPDLIFLDIKMPGRDGFAALTASSHIPYVIFTTALDQYALDAFEVGALDYLLKPFSRRRFQVAVERARAQKNGAHKMSDRVGSAQTALKPDQALSHVFLRDRGAFMRVEVADIVWIKAEGDYIRIHTMSGSHLMALRLHSICDRLDPAVFVQIHRSSVINLDFVESTGRASSGRISVQLRGGAAVESSKSGAVKLRRILTTPRGCFR